MENLKLDYKYVELLISYAPKIILAVLILLLGLWVIRKITRTAEKGLERSGVDPDLRPFLVTLMNVMMKVFLVLGVANIVGIETTSFVAVLASAAFAVGLALQGTLSNFAAGVMILIFKPYRVGDFVEIQTISGRVKEIQIFNTLVVTSYEKIIIVPNSNAINGIIGNLTSQGTIKTNIIIPVKYDSDFEKIKEIILEILRSTPEVLDATTSSVEIESFEQEGYIINVGANINAIHLEDVSQDLRHKIYIALRNAEVKMGAKKLK